MDASGSVQESVGTAMRGFLFAELKVAQTLLHVAKRTRDKTANPRRLQLALRACEAIETFLPRAPLDIFEKLQIRQAMLALQPDFAALQGDRTNGGTSASQDELRAVHDAPARVSQTKRVRGKSRRSMRNGADIAREVSRFLKECEQRHFEAEQMVRMNKSIMRRVDDAHGASYPRSFYARHVD